MIQLKRYADQPIFTPRKTNDWEAAAVFNAAAIYDNGLVHMIYRATDISSGGQEGAYINSLGYAVSPDGIHFNRLEQPVLKNDVPQEARGPEDPRIVKIGDTFYMMYTGYGGRFDDDYRICLATSKNLIDWERQGVMLDEPNKDASLFPEKIKGQYVMLHRRPPDIWVAYSDNLKTWENHTRIMTATPESAWQAAKIGISGPPIRTEDGWLLVYHGVSRDQVYSQGIALLETTDPTRVLARQSEPILVPELGWERNGHVNNVVFSCGQVVLGDEIYLYYGGADNAIGLATIKMSEVRF